MTHWASSDHEIKFKLYFPPSCKLTVRHGKSTILMVFTRKDGDVHGRTVSLPEGTKYVIAKSLKVSHWLSKMRVNRDFYT